MNWVTIVNGYIWDYLLIAALLLCAVWFTIRTRGVQFRMIPEMVRLLAKSGKTEGENSKGVSSFQAFAISVASRVGTGNLAGVATAIVVGGPGAIFWMWVTAIVGGANAFIESTLAQMFKSSSNDSFIGGPAYYIKKGLGSKLFAAIFAILLIFTFGFAFNSVQSNTITLALEGALGLDRLYVGIAITIISMVIIFGGISRIARFSQIVVPVMAIAYLIVAIVVVAMNVGEIPHIFSLIINNAMGWHQAVGGAIGVAIQMGVKRGLFSNEAGMGSAPNVAATADISHPVKQGLIQTLSVYTDTLVVCTCTAFIILCSGLFDSGATGIELTQAALSHEIGSVGGIFIAVIILFFAFTSIIGNYYYGESNLRFLTSNRWALYIFRLLVCGMVLFGSVAELQQVWDLADLSMGLMTLCNLVAIVLLGRYAIIALRDYEKQRKSGQNPQYRASTIKEIESKCECWR